MIDGNLLQTAQRSFDLNGRVAVKSMVITKSNNRRKNNVTTEQVYLGFLRCIFL